MHCQSPVCTASPLNVPMKGGGLTSAKTPLTLCQLTAPHGENSTHFKPLAASPGLGSMSVTVSSSFLTVWRLP